MSWLYSSHPLVRVVMESKEAVRGPSLAIWTHANIPLACLLEAKEPESQLWNPEQARSRQIRRPSLKWVCACRRGGGWGWQLEDRRRRQVFWGPSHSIFLRSWTGLKQGESYIWVVTLPRLERHGGTELFQWPGKGGLLLGNGGLFHSYPDLMWAFQICSLCLLSALVSLVTYFFEVCVQFSILWLFWASSNPLQQGSPAVFSGHTQQWQISKTGRASGMQNPQVTTSAKPLDTVLHCQLPKSFSFLNYVFLNVLIWYSNLGKYR